MAFGEKKMEYSTKQKKEVPVWKTPKYEQSKETALAIIKKYADIGEGDFWILMNETKTGKMAYTGLIISHNACLKLNDQLPTAQRFKPSCMALDKDGFGGSLVYTYINDEQGLYEVGEVSAENCKNAYPYAMALKRCFDRVVLKATKLAYNGVYSDSEADEFKEPVADEAKTSDPVVTEDNAEERMTAEQIVDIKKMLDAKGVPYQFALDKCAGGETDMSRLTKLQGNLIATHVDRLADAFKKGAEK